MNRNNVYENVRNALPNTRDCIVQENADCKTCKYVALFGSIAYCIYTGPRSSIYDRLLSTKSVDNTRSCLFCKYRHYLPRSSRCKKCLSTIDLYYWEPETLGKPIEIEFN